MKLIGARIKNYKSIEDSGEFGITDLTCLVGKNESGKTAVLQALSKLNPVEKNFANFDKISDYPRRNLSTADLTTPVLETKWELTQTERNQCSNHTMPNPDGTVTLQKGYNNELVWVGGLSDKAFLEAFVGEHLPLFVYFPDYNKLPGQIHIDTFIKKKNENALDFGERVFQALLDLAEIRAEELRDTAKYEELKAKLEGVSNHISDTIFKYWTQNRDLQVEFAFDQARPGDTPPFNQGWVFRIRIRNNRHRATVSFQERSTGFVWFFSFLVWFSRIRHLHGQRLILLLDEPGLSLHARAQADLLRFFKEELAPQCQLIYSTHSPFMIDADALEKVRTVEDRSFEGRVIGTKVDDRVLSTDVDTVFPLQAALGYDLTQTLFVGKHALLVEGPSDLIYLKWFSRELRQKGRKSLDPRWVITPCGGLDKISTFVALFGGNRIHVAALLDIAVGQKNKIRQLQESNLLRTGHVFTAANFTGTDEADTEDVIGRNLYGNLVSACFNLTGSQAVPLGNGANKRAVREVEEHFQQLPAGAPSFDHYSPAVFLQENGEIARLHPDFPLALDRFETLFTSFNKLLENV